MIVHDLVEESCSVVEVEDDNDAANEEEWTSKAVRQNQIVVMTMQTDLEANAEANSRSFFPVALKNLRRVSGECDSSSESMKNESRSTSETSKRPLHKGNFFPA
ncbi:hypothetical protein OIU84_018233 [Salix udensis]|uniref:Uncharacterized protein n=1 Tax=Salix udensis TaxID=889485 RepID=A0AAD6J6D7_9ROSI|nr:hypothetical protein OIU84_018233 [Salix udensis]